MTRPVLEVTFRSGEPFAAYLYLAGARRKAKSTRELAASIVGDFGARGDLIGIEILAFDRRTLARINPVLAAHGGPVLSTKDLAPLRAA